MVAGAPQGCAWPWKLTIKVRTVRTLLNATAGEGVLPTGCASADKRQTAALAAVARLLLTGQSPADGARKVDYLTGRFGLVV